MSFTPVTATLETWCGPLKCYPCNPLGNAAWSNSVSGASPYVYGRNPEAQLKGFRPFNRYDIGFYRTMTTGGSTNLYEGFAYDDYVTVKTWNNYTRSISGGYAYDDQDAIIGSITVERIRSGRFYNSDPEVKGFEDYGPISDAPTVYTNGNYPGPPYETTLTDYPDPPEYPDPTPFTRTTTAASDVADGNGVTVDAYWFGLLKVEATGQTRLDLSDPDTVEDAWERVKIRNAVDQWRPFSTNNLGFVTGPWRRDELAEARGGGSFGRIVRGRIGVATTFDAGASLRLLYQLRKYTLPVLFATADKSSFGNSGRYATVSTTTTKRTTVADVMTVPIDSRGPIDCGHASWEGVELELAGTFHINIPGPPASVAWALPNGTWDSRSWFELAGDYSKASPNGWTQLSRFTVRKVERTPLNAIVSDTTVTLTTAFDPQRAIPVTPRVPAEPETRGNTVSFTVTLWEIWDPVTATWAPKISGELTYLVASRTGSWGFRGEGADTYYSKSTYYVRQTHTFTDATPPAHTPGVAAGAPPTGWDFEATYTATMTAPGVYTFEVEISGTIEGRDVSYSATIPGCSRRSGSIVASRPGLIASPVFPQAFDRIPYDLTLSGMSQAGTLVPAFQEGWSIPSSMPAGWDVTPTKHEIVQTSSSSSPTWWPNVIVSGSETATLVSSSIEERICDKLPEEHPAAPGYLSADEEIWEAASGEICFATWFAFLGDAD